MAATVFWVPGPWRGQLAIVPRRPTSGCTLTVGFAAGRLTAAR